MNIVSVDNVSKRYGERVLFEGISFGLQIGSRVALIAGNGTGKTSLLKILAGHDVPDSGEVVYRKGMRIGYLAQDPDFDKESTVLDTLFQADTPLVNALRDYELSVAREDVETMQKAIDRLDRLGGWDYEARAKQILATLKIDRFDQKVGSLSGGQVKRLALAHLLLDTPDFIILDEPTNHLDVGMVEWLEEQLSTAKTTLLMVTHDRYFLNNVCSEILEMEDGTLYRYKGNYEYFLEKRAERHAANAASMDKAKNLFKKELEWMRRQPKARTGKSKARIDSFKDLKKTVKGAKHESELTIESGMERLGSKVLELHNVGKSYGDVTLFKGISYKFSRVDRVGIVGENGSGKSTLVKIMTGRENPDTGKVVLGDTVVFGYYSQEGLKYKAGQRVIEVLKDIAENVPSAAGGTRTAAQMLELFLFPPHMHYVHVEKLSGGEKRRLYLLTVLMRNPNFLILDEPTNDLDILTINVLEEYLKGFKGCLVVVSHDRFFMDKLVEHVFVFRKNKEFKDFPGNYSRYREWENNQELSESRVQKSVPKQEEAPKQVKPKEKTKLSYKEQREFDTLTESIEALEIEKKQLTTLMNSGEGDHEKLAKWAARFEEVTTLLDEQEMRWLELSEYAS
jgi:ATP-binding cassette subfamily F protein uup